MAYQYKLANFEGPLDLLLHLIEKHAIDIYDIPIVEITSQYMAYLETWKRFDIHYSSEFLVMAATLLHIKSRMLLPLQKAEDEEEEDPRDALVKRLVEYQQIKALAQILEERHQKNHTLFTRHLGHSEWGTQAVYDLRQVPLFSLYQEALRRLEETEKDMPQPTVVVTKESISVEGATLRLRDAITREGCLSFRKYMGSLQNKELLVNSFLAILEMVKLHILALADNHGDFLLLKGEAYDSE